MLKQDGTVVVKAGETMPDKTLESMDFLVQGVIGQVK